MPKSIETLLEGNRQWVTEKLALSPDYFKELADRQNPQFLWIGCSDSRVPANEITRTRSGDIFVHRNIANLVIHTDMNMLSVLHYAVEVLKVKHIIVVGHYNCGGVKAAMSNQRFGFIDNWLRHIKDVYRVHQEELDAIADEETRYRRFVELNVIEQVSNLSKSSVIQEAWKTNQLPILHGWAYDVADGIIHTLDVKFKDNGDITNDIYRYDLSDNSTT